MKAVILSAGQGRRLLPWTHDLPKCLLAMAGRSVLAWQLEALAANGVEDVVVVTGFAAGAVRAEIESSAPRGMTVSTIHNPFYAVADNVASVWLVRERLRGEVALINGDTLFAPELFAKATAQASAAITVTVDHKDSYDADDMKVQMDAGRVLRIGKTLPAELTNAESIGVLILKGMGGPLFAKAVEAVVDKPGGVSRWYLSAVDELAAKGSVGAVSIAGMDWTEIDYPGDLGRAEMLAREWCHRNPGGAFPDIPPAATITPAPSASPSGG